MKIALNSIFAKNTNSLRAESPIGDPFYQLSEVDSTNNYAMRQVQAQMAGHGATYAAAYQNAGKGQRGKAWNSISGENIMMSVVLEPAGITVENQFILNIAVALACFDFFEKHSNGDTSIKWPNDIYWRDRKAGGILIENLLSGKRLKYTIVGIGININQTLFPTHLPNPVSLKQVTGRNYNVTELAKQLCQHLQDRWAQLKTQENGLLINEYSKRLYKLNTTSAFRYEGHIINAKVKGVNEKGELLLASNSGTIHSYKNIEWLITN